METKINIAEILKDKPQGTKLYDLLRNIDVELYRVHLTVAGDYIEVISTNEVGSTLMFDYSKLGTEKCWLDGLQILLPSKGMRDWEKFSWEKGDVLQNNDHNTQVIFDGFISDTYEMVRCKYWLKVDNGIERFVVETNVFTKDYFKVSEELSQCYINEIENRCGGKLNLETLEIEKQPEFKDGDIVALVVRKCTHIAIFQSRQEAYIGFHAVFCQNDELLLEKPFREDVGDIELRLATDSEKQQLFDTLAKEGKAWDSEHKMIVDIKKEHQFKPFEKVLVRDSYDDVWRASFFSHIKENDGRYVTTCLVWKFCIPYEGNEHLLGTTDNFE